LGIGRADALELVQETRVKLSATGAVVLILLLCAVLGFHWITYPAAPHGRTLCVLTKDHLTFADTVIASDSLLGFTVRHPALAGQIMLGQAHCVSF